MQEQCVFSTCLPLEIEFTILSIDTLTTMYSRHCIGWNQWYYIWIMKNNFICVFFLIKQKVSQVYFVPWVCAHYTLSSMFNTLNRIIKIGTVCVISSHTLFKKGHVRFTMVPLKCYVLIISPRFICSRNAQITYVVKLQ